MEKIFEIGLNIQDEKIAELADNARKQLKIEIMLKEIKRIREDYLITDLEIKKDRIKTNIEQLYKILSTDAVY